MELNCKWPDTLVQIKIYLRDQKRNPSIQILSSKLDIATVLSEIWNNGVCIVGKSLINRKIYFRRSIIRNSSIFSGNQNI